MKRLPLLWSILCLLSCAGNIYPADPALVIDSGGNTRFIKSVIFTKDGNYLVSVGDDKVIRVWNLKTKKTERTVRDQFGVCSNCRIATMALSPDNTYLAVGGKFPGADEQSIYAIYIYNFQTGKRLQLLKGHKAKVLSLAFSADGKQLASGSAYSTDEARKTDSDGSVRIWKLAQQGWELAHRLSGHEDAVSSLDFSSDGQWLVSGSHDNDLLLWNLNTTPVTKRLLQRHFSEVYGVAFSPDGRYIVSGGLDWKVNLWDAKGDFIRELGEPNGGVTSLVFSGDKENLRVLVGLNNGTSTILSVPDGKLLSTFDKGDDTVRAVAFSQTDQNLVASGGGVNGQIWLWQADNPKSDKTIALVGRGQTFWSLGFAQDGSSIAFGTLHTSNEPNKYGPLQQLINLKPARSVKAPQQVSARSANYEISLGGKVQRETDYLLPIDKREGYQLKTVYGQTEPRRIGPQKFINEPRRLNELEILREGTKVATIKRDLATGRTHRCYTLTNDGRYIVSGGESGFLALYDTKSGRFLHEFVGHTNDVWSVAVSPDGRFVVSGSSDQTIKLWDINAEQYLLSFFVAADAEWVAWSPQGYYVSSLNGDNYFGWQVEQIANEQPTVYNAAQFQKIFYRPELISEYLTTRDFKTAVEQTVRSEQNTFVGANSTPENSTGNFVVDAQELLKVLPPKITILAPSDKETVSQRLLPVKVIVTSDNLPIREVTISLNGFRKGVFKGDPWSKEPSKRVEVSTMIALEPDENTLIVTASHEKATSDPEIRTINYKPIASKPDTARPVSTRATQQLPPKIQRATAASIAPGKVESRLYPVIDSVSSFPLVRKLLDQIDDGSGPFLNVIQDAPTVEILTPAQSPAPFEVTEDYVNLSVKVNATGAGTKVRALVNGSLRHEQNAEPGIPFPIQVPLDNEGENIVTVIASSGGLDSIPQTRRVTFRNLSPERPNLIFLGIGISGYSKFDPKLQFADKDARDVANLLCRLNDSTLFKEVKTRVLSNADASKANILRDIDWLNREATHDNDLRILLVSGHGGSVGQQIKRYYFYAQDQVPGEEPEILSVNWTEVLNRLLDRGEAAGQNVGRGHILLLVDTCRAGEAGPKEFMNVKDANGMVFFGASDSRENSTERTDLKNGVFTKAVIEGLSGAADQSSELYPKDGKIDFWELKTWIERRVADLNSSQHPSFDYSRGLRTFNIVTTSVGTTPDQQNNCTGGPNP
jgi:WD40 repeat protein